MPQFTVRWIVEGEKTLEAESIEAAEKAVHEQLVGVLTDGDRWPEDLGARSVQGAGRNAAKAD